MSGSFNELSRDNLLSSVSLDNLSLSIHHKPFRNGTTKNWSYGERVIDDYDLFLCYSGKAQFKIEDEHYEASEGCAILIPPRARFSIVTKGPPYPSSIAQHFSLHAFSGVDFLSIIDFQKMIRLSNAEELLPLYVRYADMYSEKSFSLTGHSLFLYILFSFLDEAYIKDRLDAYNNHIIFRFLMLLEAHALEKDVLDRLMTISPYCLDHTVHVFREHIGVTPRAYVEKKRMTRAKDLLLRGYSVAETASQCAFDDVFYFSRRFKMNTGVSPREFRKRLLAD